MAKLGKILAAGATVAAAAAGAAYVLMNKEQIAQRGRDFLEKLKEKGIVEIEFGEADDCDDDCCADEDDFECGCAAEAAECAAEAAECAAEAAELAAEAAEAAEAAKAAAEAAAE